MITNFANAALPWIIMGLCIAIICGKLVHQKKDSEGKKNYMLEGMFVGMCIGVSVNWASNIPNGIGISLGMLVGTVVGSCIEKKA